jgi:hypothetical protein
MAALGTLPLMSPRAMGETAYLGGRVAKLLSRIPVERVVRAANPLRITVHPNDDDALAPPSDVLNPAAGNERA